MRRLGLMASACLLTALGAWWAWWSRRPVVDPHSDGLAAYARGDWDRAARLARERSKQPGASNDLDALRLLARASVRLGRNETATAIFDRLGAGSMKAEDLYLLGLALKRFGNPQGAREVWEQAVAADPNHADALWELSRGHYEADRLSEAADTARRLALQPGWQARGEALLGMIQAQRHDPSGALAFWERARERMRQSNELRPEVLVPPKELALRLAGGGAAGRGPRSFTASRGRSA